MFNAFSKLKTIGTFLNGIKYLTIQRRGNIDVLYLYISVTYPCYE